MLLCPGVAKLLQSTFLTFKMGSKWMMVINGSGSFTPICGGGGSVLVRSSSNSRVCYLMVDHALIVQELQPIWIIRRRNHFLKWGGEITTLSLHQVMNSSRVLTSLCKLYLVVGNAGWRRRRTNMDLLLVDLFWWELKIQTIKGRLVIVTWKSSSKFDEEFLDRILVVETWTLVCVWQGHYWKWQHRHVNVLWPTWLLLLTGAAIFLNHG